MQIDCYEYYSKPAKLGTKGAWPRSRDVVFKFLDLLNISRTAKDRNLKFGVPIDLDECCSTHANLGDKMDLVYVTLPTFNFGIPSISQEG